MFDRYLPRTFGKDDSHFQSLDFFEFFSVVFIFILFFVFGYFDETRE